MGDKMGNVLAECIQDIPEVESINLANNNLTDESLPSLLLAFKRMKNLKELDLSRNDIDGLTSDALAAFLSDPECPIRRLILKSADVDDFECGRFVEAMCTNLNLLELDLSQNLLGSAEALNAVNPDVTTGGERLAEFIVTKNCRLQVLVLAWNCIRGDSAATLARALSGNFTITYLNLSHNGLGNHAGEVLGNSIMLNRTLKVLNVTNNNFASTATLCISVGSMENLAMHELIMDENPVGVLGSRALMQVPVIIGGRAKISASGCNTLIRDSKSWFDVSSPLGEYTLKLSDPYERSIALSLLQIVAAHSHYIFAKVVFEDPGHRKPETLKLTQAISREKVNFFTQEQNSLLQALTTMEKAASNIDFAAAIFKEVLIY